MTPYANLNGNSGVVAYEIGPGWIAIQYRKRARPYLYTAELNGADVIREMQKLANAGRGLATYVSQNKPEFAR